MARNLGFSATDSGEYYFISYNNGDEERVSQYAQLMAKAGMPLWYDAGISVGTKWKKQIAEHIKNCKAVIMFLSKNIFRKEESYVYTEYELAVGYDKNIYTILLDDLKLVDIPTDYAVWWIQVTHHQCIQAFEYPTPAACVEKFLSEVGFDGKKTPPIKDGPRKPEQTVTTGNIEVKTYTNGDVYEGELKNGHRHGKGTYTWANGDRYEGEWKNGKRNGIGTYTWTGGSYYTGGWKDDLKDGKAEHHYSDGSTFRGEYVKDQKQGFGVYTWKDGDRYEGEYYQNKKQGYGLYLWASGSRYSGEWKADTKHGKGTYFWADGDVYDGEWVEDQRTGRGKYTTAAGALYVGTYLNGNLQGVGFYYGAETQVFDNGIQRSVRDVYFGTFQDDEYDGTGMLIQHHTEDEGSTTILTDITTYEGEFKNGKYHGQGKLTHSDDTVEEGYWENGVKIK